MDVSRRSFLRFTGGTALTAFLLGSGHDMAPASRTTPTLDPAEIPKFRTPLPRPGVMPRAGRLPGGIDYYEISLRQLRQQVLPPGLPQTTLWGYGPLNRPELHSSPSLTIEAQAGRPIAVRWVNQLVDDSGQYLSHLLPVDPTMHWCNPEGGTEHRDHRPNLVGRTYVPFDRYTDPKTQYTGYAGPVPMVPHLHGAMAVGDESDGYTEAWYLPAAGNIPPGYAEVGTWWDFMSRKYRHLFGTAWRQGENTSRYPNANRACQMWFHDHALGITRLNVYAGALGLLFLRGGDHGDEQVRDARTGGRAWLPGPGRSVPAPQAGSHADFEIPLAIYDRSFKADGSWFYPDTRAFFDDVTGPYIPDSEISPMWNPEFFANTVLVNGVTWPRLEVEQRRYRFRVLNGCNSRFLILDFGGLPGASSWVIGTQGGFLPRPVSVDRQLGGRLLMGPAERYDVIVDFTNVPRGRHVLRNLGPDEPFGGGEPGADFDAADPATTGQVIAFDVVAARGRDRSTHPEHLELPRHRALPRPDTTRRVALLEEMDMTLKGSDHPVAEAKLGAVVGDPATGTGVATGQEWMDPVTENPSVGSTEVWEIYNTTVDAHPIHVHEVAFEVVNRQAITAEVEMSPRDPHTRATIRLAGGSAPVEPLPQEQGTKDTVIAFPGEVTRIKARFGKAGQYVWHCHVLEHEDNEMMRPLRVGPLQPGQPPDGTAHGSVPKTVGPPTTSESTSTDHQSH